MRKLLLCAALCGLCLGNSLNVIKETKTIRIGVRIAQAPYSVLENGEFHGFEVDLAKAVGKKIVGDDGTIELVGVNAADRIPFLKDNKADLMLANFSITPERANQVDFGSAYLSNVEAVVSQKSAAIRKVNDLSAVRVAVIPDTTSEEWLKEKAAGMDLTMIHCENTKNCLEKMQNGEAQAYVHTNILIATLPLVDQSLEMSMPNVGNYTFIAPAVAKGNKELLEAVNHAILDLSEDGFFQKAYDDDLEPFYKGTLDRKYLLLDDLYNSMMTMDEEQ